MDHIPLQTGKKRGIISESLLINTITRQMEQIRDSPPGWISSVVSLYDTKKKSVEHQGL